MTFGIGSRAIDSASALCKPSASVAPLAVLLWDNAPTPPPLAPPQPGKAQALAAVVVALGHGARQVADAADIGRPLGHADRTARIQQVEAVRRLQHLLVSGQRQLLFHQVLRLFLMRAEGDEQELGIAVL